MAVARVFAAVVFALTLVGAPAFADAPSTGAVTGTVKALGADPLPGVEVKLEGERGSKSAVTDAEGRFRFSAVLPGAYVVTAAMEGLKGASQSILVEPDAPADVTLELSESLSEEITVSAEAPLVSRYDVSAGGTLGNAELASVVGGGARQYRAQLSLLPGVFNDDNSPTGGRPSVQGVEGPRQVYFVDGVDVSFSRWGGGSQLNLPVAALEQLTLKSSGADAEYSRTVGAYTTAIIKSGTNAYHGSAHWMAQNLSWNAENENVPEERPDDRADSWEASLGGRIVRDRLFFFAAAKRDDNPGYSVMADGVSVVDQGSIQESRLLKLDLQANDRHHLAATWVDTPFTFPWWNDETFGDLATVSTFQYPGDLLSGRWSWTATDSVLVEANIGITEPEQNRELFVEPDIDPDCAPNQPCGNAWVYRPLDGTALFYNGIGLPLGAGFTTFPRDQYNASTSWFRGDHDFKFGVDYQELAWELGGVTPPFCRGRGYSETAPGGFNSNTAGVVAWCRFFPTKAAWEQGYGPISFEQTNGALYARDRWTIGKWLLNLGARVDRQDHENDRGTEVLSSTDVVPRVSVSYDLWGNGKLLVLGSAGRYVSHVEQEWSRNFNLSPTGRDQYEQYNWNRVTNDYDIRTVVVGPGSSLDIPSVDPPRKDEVTVGTDWQFHPDWALRVRGILWERKGAPQVLTQLDATGEALAVPEDTPGIEMEHKALSFSVQRRFRDGWTVGASYDLSDTKGNCQYSDNGGCDTFYGELRAWTDASGTPMSEVNRWGNLREDRPHIFKVRGAYRWDVTERQAIDVGAFYYIHSGYPWNRVEEQTIPDALDPRNTNQTVTVYLEPQGSRRTPTQQQLNLNAGWSFPLGGKVEGELGAEVINVTDEQELIGIGGLPTTGVPLLQSGNFQNPRLIRALLSVRF
jgi:hypothetical protein